MSVTTEARVDDTNPELLALVRETRAGQTQAYSEIVRICQKRVIGLALVIVRDTDAAEDVAQEAFVRAYSHLHRYDDRQPFYPWLASITVRLSQNWLRTEKRQRARVEAAQQETPNKPHSDFLSDLVGNESDRHLWQCVADLPETERTATLLFYQQDMKVSEIADILQVSDGTIKTSLYRARQKLKVTLLAQEK